MLSVEATGKSIEQAIENALFELKAIREDVDIKVLDNGGLFKKAKVFVQISEDVIEKYQAKEVKHTPKIEESPKVEKVVAKVEEEVVEEQPIKEEIAKTEQSTKQETSKIVKTIKGGQDLAKAKEFVENLLSKISLTANVEATETTEEICIDINGETDIIGYRGEGLNALNYITSVVVSKNNRHSKRIKIDCENYRSRREESLVALAHRLGRKAQKTNSSIKLEPMSANERRIIHNALTDWNNIETISKGEEPHRYIVISPK